MCRFMRVSRYARLARFARLHPCETMRPPHDSRLSWGIRIMGVIRRGDPAPPAPPPHPGLTISMSTRETRASNALATPHKHSPWPPCRRGRHIRPLSKATNPAVPSCRALVGSRPCCPLQPATHPPSGDEYPSPRPKTAAVSPCNTPALPPARPPSPAVPLPPIQLWGRAVRWAGAAPAVPAAGV